MSIFKGGNSTANMCIIRSFDDEYLK